MLLKWTNRPLFKALQIQKEDSLQKNQSGDDYTINDIGSITTRTVANVSSTGLPPDIDKLFAMVRLIDNYSLRIKVDTGADTCIITAGDLKKLNLQPNWCLVIVSLLATVAEPYRTREVSS